MQVYVRVKALGKRKDVLPPKPYELPEGIGSLRELLTAFVESEVERYNNKEPELPLLSCLTAEEIEAQSEAGKVGFGRLWSDKKEEKAKMIRDLGPVAVGATDETLLAALVYCEAGNQPYEGQLAVASVVMNRVRSGAYPNTVAGVIYASGQFTPAMNGKVAMQLQKGVPDICLQAAQAAIGGATNVGMATHFRRWTGQEGLVIGAHVFY